jgi:hypothetical protein
MSYVSVDVDIDEFDDYAIIDEFMERYKQDEFFRSACVQRNVFETLKNDESLNDDLEKALDLFNQKNYTEMMIWFERGLGSYFKGLGDLKVMK